MRSLILSAIFTILLGIPAIGEAQEEVDLRLSIAAPEASSTRQKTRNGITTVSYTNRGGILSTTQWPLIFRIESTTALGFVAQKSGNAEREALVVSDPDECLHLGSLFADVPPGTGTFDSSCVAEDEIHVEVQTEKFDGFKVFDNPTTGNDAIRAKLVDDKFNVAPPRNKPYLNMFGEANPKPVGPSTGGPLPPPPDPLPIPYQPDELDGHGWGTDDDIASLVLIANIGGARVFDENFVLDDTVIRNMAGFVSTVSSEDLDGKSQSAITVSMHILSGVFEPIAIIDTDTANPAFDYAMRVDSELIEFNMVEEPPTNPAPGDTNPFYDELLSQYYPVRVTVRAVLVNGKAPAFIHDTNGDKHFTAHDLLTTHDVISEEVIMTLNLTHENLLTLSADAKCPPKSLIHGDVDGNGSRGDLPNCSGTSGATRQRRAPR